jgi:oligosaccharide repeat unit polymerase
MIEFSLAANTIFFIVVFVLLAQRGYINVYSGLFIYSAFHFVAFVQRPIFVHLFDLRSEFEFMKYMPTEATFLTTLLVANIGYLSFIAGYLMVLRFQPVQPTFEMPRLSRIERNSFIASFVVLSPLIIYSFFLAFTMRQQYGAEVLDELGKINMTVDVSTGHHLFNDTTAYVVMARHMALPFATVAIFVSGGKWWSYALILICAFISLQIGERWPLVISVLVVITSTLYLRKQRALGLRHYVIGGLVLVLFVALGQNRNLLVRFLLTGDFDVKFDFFNSSFGNHPDFANFEFLTFVIGKVPDVSKTYSYFTQYLGLFTQPIPRILWPEKPVGSPIILVNLQEYGRWASRTASLVGDGWISLGYAGVVITLSGAGAIFGTLYKRFCRTPVSVYYCCAYFWVYALLLQWARDGGYRIADFLFFCVSPIMLAYGLRFLFLPPQAGRRQILGTRPR